MITQMTQLSMDSRNQLFFRTGDSLGISPNSSPHPFSFKREGELADSTRSFAQTKASKLLLPSLVIKRGDGGEFGEKNSPSQRALRTQRSQGEEITQNPITFSQRSSEISATSALKESRASQATEVHLLLQAFAELGIPATFYDRFKKLWS